MGRMNRRTKKFTQDDVYEPEEFNEEEYYQPQEQKEYYQPETYPQQTPEQIQPNPQQQIQEQLRQAQIQRQEIPPQQQPPSPRFTNEERPYPEPQYYDDEEDEPAESPLSILDEIKRKPTPKGVFAQRIGGRPVDLHVLEDYITKISPFALKTLLRYHNAKTMEEIKSYSQGKTIGISGGTIILILAAVGMAILGIAMIFFMPDIMNSFKMGL
jgi:hypothetical protein